MATFWDTRVGKVLGWMMHESNSGIGNIKNNIIYMKRLHEKDELTLDIVLERFEYMLRATEQIKKGMDWGYERFKKDFEEPNGAMLITLERERQILKEGWTSEHDDKYTDNALILAASCYLLHDDALSPNSNLMLWPWEESFYKPTTKIRNLEKAGALIAAEIDRLKRLEQNDKNI